MEKHGFIAKLSDGRVVIVYDKQPLASKGKIILHLVDDNYNLINDSNGKPKIILKDISSYNEEMPSATLIGYVD